MLTKQIDGARAEHRWLVVLGLSACLLALGGCSDDPKKTTEDESPADEDDDESPADDDDVEDDDDDDSPSGSLDAGRKDAGGGGKDAGGGGKDAGGGGGSDASRSDAQTPPKSDAGMTQRDASVSPPPSSGSACTPAPSGKFETTSGPGGPGGDYVIFRPTTLGEGGFKHPPVAWGNGLATYPDAYTESLMNIASNGFVIIANPGSGSDSQVVRQGLEWLLEQNASGEYAGKLAVDCAGTIGYSMGGGAAIGSGSHPAVKAIVSIHGLPDQAGAINGPLLLTTSDGDSFVTKAGFVMPNYTGSNMHPTIMATHATVEDAALFAVFGDHLEPMGAGGLDTEPTIAWLRYWLYGDESQRDWFFGASCKLCSTPWTDIQKKNHSWD